MFSVEEALAVCTSKITQRRAQRLAHRPAKYTMFFGNDQKRYEGKVNGATCSELVKLFHSNHAQFRWAVITPINDPKTYVRFYNKSLGKKFTDPNRTVVRKK